MGVLMRRGDKFAEFDSETVSYAEANGWTVAAAGEEPPPVERKPEPAYPFESHRITVLRAWAKLAGISSPTTLSKTALVAALVESGWRPQS